MRNMETIILKRLSLLMVLLYLHTKSGNSALITFPRDTEVLINHSTYFNCSTSILSEQIHWYHYLVGENRTNYVYYKGQFNQIYADRYSIEIDTKTGEYNLIIRSVQPGDAGRYVCRDDGGLGNISSAELIVLDSTPTCLSNMKPNGIAGPNRCYLPLEKLELSCSVSYNGNNPPILQWKTDGNEAPILEGISTDYSGKRATVNLTINSTVEMDGEFFTCGTTRSHDKKLSCSTDPAKINYAVGQPVILNITKGENVTCSANASVPCTYRWFFDYDTQDPVSYNQVLTTNRLGNYSCEASCPINGINCTFAAMHIYVLEEEPSTASEDRPNTKMLIAILIPTVAVAILLMTVACVLFSRTRKAKKEKTADEDEAVPLNEIAKQISGPMKESPSPVDEGNNEISEPNANISAYNEEPLLSKGTVTNTAEEVTPLNKSSSVDNGAEKETSVAELGGNSIIQTRTNEKEITTKASEEMGRAIAGVAALDGIVYVVSDRSSEVEMFDIRTYEFKIRWNVVELDNPWDLASCNGNKCLYIMDLRSTNAPKRVIRVDSNGKTLVQWSTGERYGNLSVTCEKNVVVTICDSRRLFIYGPDGTRRNVVLLSEDMIHPSHALKMRNGQFLICHGINKDNIHRLCILNEDGEILKSSFDRMDEPSYLAVDEAGLVFVADQINRRVIVMNSDLELIGEVASEKNGLRGPQRICLHGKLNGKLLVVDNDVELESRRRMGKLLIFNYDLRSQ